jgi:hypothetical protein
MRYPGTAIILLPGHEEGLACGTFASRVSERVAHGEAARLFATIICLTQQADFPLTSHTTSQNCLVHFALVLRYFFTIVTSPRPVAPCYLRYRPEVQD